MEKYKCNICGYVYDPELGDSELEIAAGTPFEAIDDSWVCPICGAKKPDFSQLTDGAAAGQPGSDRQA
ncbi:MAG: rubredoxin [Treponema sp.]|nr:rubredoxin [Treponema sp.]